MSELIGRFHPLIVHLPVGILLFAFIIQLFSKYARFQYLKIVLPFVLASAIFFSILAWFTGWIMPKEGVFDERLIRFHFWTAASMTIGTVLVYLCLISENPKLQKLYFPLFVITIILLGFTGHYGGSLTHGENHLTSPLTSPQKPQVQSVDSLYVYQDIIKPILEKRCYSCHNEGKKRGGLLMTSEKGLLKGGDKGKIILEGNSPASPIISRLRLPLEDEEHMPPSGKMQLSENEISLMDWWVTEGASFTKKVDRLNRSDKIKTILKTYEQGKGVIDVSGLEALSVKDMRRLESNGISVFKQSETSPLVRIKISRDSSDNTGKLKQLKKCASNINELDLSYSSIDNEMLSVLKKLKNLQVLKLQHTEIGSEALKNLENLEHLHTLNLYDTKVDDDGLFSLDKVKSLRSLYVWQTSISGVAIDSFKDKHPLIKVESGVDRKLFGTSVLKPPLIITERESFEDTISVQLKVGIPRVNIYYSLDGSMPDSTSLKYVRPIVIDKTTLVKTMTAKEGWQASTINQKVITQKGIAINNIKLSQPPNDKYAADGKRTLIDSDKGSSSFSDGSWLGFYAQNLTATITLDSVEEVSKVVVGALEDTGSYIFYPKEITVSTSMDGMSYTTQHSMIVSSATEPSPASHQSFLLNFPRHAAKYIKIILNASIKNPEWHNAPGADNWLFLDEIIINE